MLTKTMMCLFVLLFSFSGVSYAKRQATVEDDKADITFEPILGVQILKSANNSIVNLSLEHEFAPPYSLIGFTVHDVGG